MRGATRSALHIKALRAISIHAPHARSDRLCEHGHCSWIISIHAPHARSDQEMKASMEDTEYFNPRSSCEERRVNAGDNVVWNGISIHAPHARSDMAYVALTLSAAYFNPRSSCEERLAHLLAGEGRPPISIHAPHARSDVGKIYWRHQKEISIHAPHARSDATTFCMDAVVSNFNPRSSCEERPDVLLFTNHRDIFQSTLLMRGATPCWFSYIVL